MTAAHSLQKKLKAHLPWNQSRIELLAYFVLGLIQVGSVNLTKIARTFSAHNQIDSNHRRLRRFLAKFPLKQEQITQLIVDWWAPNDAWILCLDRTQWKFGRTPINVMMISIATEGGALPICWCLLNKEGCSNTDERITLIETVIKRFGKSRIRYLVADREFYGSRWLKWLIKEEIPFRLRIRNTTLIRHKHRTYSLPAYRYFSLSQGESMRLRHPRMLWGTQVWISAHLSGKERLIVISNEPSDQMLQEYLCRWVIEVLFQCCKGRGFSLEETHVTDPHRLEKLVAVVALAYGWCYELGLHEHKKNPIRVLKHGRKAQSIFRLGLNQLNRLLRATGSQQRFEMARFLARIGTLQRLENLDPEHYRLEVA